MARSLTAAMITEIKAGTMRPVIFVEIEFLSGTTRVWSGIGTFSFDGKTWIGVGDLGKISRIPETSQIAPSGITLSLSGIPASMVTNVLTDSRQGKPVKIWLGALDSNDVLIVDPYQSFAGRMDVPAIEEGPETSTATFTVENELIDLKRTRVRRYTPDDQIIDFPGDKGFDYVGGLQEINLQWGFGASIPRELTDEEIEEQEEREEQIEEEEEREFGSGS